MPDSQWNSSRLRNHEQLKNLKEVISLFPLTTCAEVYQFIPEFMEKYQSEHKVKFRNDIGSLVEQIVGPPCLQIIYSRCYLFRLIFSLTTNSQLSLLLEVPSQTEYRPAWRVDRARQKRYDREAYIYREVLPRIHAVWPKDRQPPFPRLYASTASGILLLEDLSESTFHSKGVGSLLDLAEARAVMKSLGRFHATSIAVIKEKSVRVAWDAQTPETVIRTFGGPGGAILFSSACIQYRKHIFPQTGEEAQNSFEKFRKYSDKIMKSYYRPRTKGPNVFVHGDLSLKNILFSGKDQCRFINFQLSRRGSPAVDVIHFLMSSVKIEVVETYRDILLSSYLKEFNDVVVRAGEKYHMIKFRADLLAYKTYIFHDLLRIVHLWGEDLEEATYFWDFAFKKIVKSNKFIRTVKYWLKFFQFE